MRPQVCVFLGSGSPSNPRLVEAVEDVGRLLAVRDVELVFGGVSVGLMGVFAGAVRSRGGALRGVTTSTLFATMPHLDAPLEVTKSFHMRKREMLAGCSGVVALPGGYGTLDELFEVLNLISIGEMQARVGILNAAGFFEPLAEQLRRARAEGLASSLDNHVLISRAVPEVIDWVCGSP